MKKLFILLLSAILMIGALTGCASSEELTQKVIGVWAYTTEADEDLKRQQLESIGMTEVELPLLENLSFSYDLCYEFNQDGTWCYRYDTDSMRAAMNTLYSEVFDALYNNLTVLEEAYQVTFDCTREEFKQLYAETQGLADYTEMIYYFAENCFDYEALGRNLAYGTYSVKGKRIILEDQIGDMDGEVEYSLEGNTLTLHFADGVEVYTRR